MAEAKLVIHDVRVLSLLAGTDAYNQKAMLTSTSVLEDDLAFGILEYHKSYRNGMLHSD